MAPFADCSSRTSSWVSTTSSVRAKTRRPPWSRTWAASGMAGELLVGAEQAVRLQQVGEAELRDDVDQAGAAEASGRLVGAADHLELDPAVREHDALDRALGRAHAAQDLPALERRAGGRGRRHHALVVAADDLAVRADVDEQPLLGLPREAGRHDVAHDVGADVRPDRREQRDAALGVDGEAGVGRAQVLRLQERGDERRQRDRARVDAEQQVQHRGVADDDGLVDVLGGPRRAAANTSSSSPFTVASTAVWSWSIASGPVIAWPMRAITSAPNVACRLIVESTAATAPLRRSTSVATTVVVPMSNETPNIRSRVSPGSTSTRWSPTTVAVTS